MFRHVFGRQAGRQGSKGNSAEAMPSSAETAEQPYSLPFSSFAGAAIYKLAAATRRKPERESERRAHRTS